MAIAGLDPLLLLLAPALVVIRKTGAQHRPCSADLLVADLDDRLLELHLRCLFREGAGVDAANVARQDLAIHVEIVEQELAAPEPLDLPSEGEWW
jgi:hypothetical protein